MFDLRAQVRRERLVLHEQPHLCIQILRARIEIVATHKGQPPVDHERLRVHAPKRPHRLPRFACAVASAAISG